MVLLMSECFLGVDDTILTLGGSGSAAGFWSWLSSWLWRRFSGARSEAGSGPKPGCASTAGSGSEAGSAAGPGAGPGPGPVLGLVLGLDVQLDLFVASGQVGCRMLKIEAGSGAGSGSSSAVGSESWV
jgi:hypothetical protein